MNHLLLSSVFPASWKISEVIPLSKDGDPELANSVSLLPAIKGGFRGGPSGTRPLLFVQELFFICERVSDGTCTSGFVT